MQRCAEKIRRIERSFGVSRQDLLPHISPPPLRGSGIYLRVVTQHLRAGLNSSAALRAWGYPTPRALEAAHGGRRRTARNGCPPFSPPPLWAFGIYLRLAAPHPTSRL